MRQEIDLAAQLGMKYVQYKESAHICFVKKSNSSERTRTFDIAITKSRVARNVTEYIRSVLVHS